MRCECASMTRSISSADTTPLLSPFQIAKTPTRDEGRLVRALDLTGADTSARSGKAASLVQSWHVGLDKLISAELRGDLRPRDPYRAPLPNPSPDVAVVAEAKLGVHADLGKAVT